MWPGDQNNIIHNLLREIASRVLLLAIVCILQLKLQPRMCYITEVDLLTVYKRPRHDSYVPIWAMLIIIVFVPILFFYMVFTITKNYVDIVQAMLAWTLALSITALTTETLKLVVGRPRPDFFYRCFPNEKITPDLCCTGNIRDVIEGRKSFPSGHSSFSFCSLGFLSIWMCGKFKVMSKRRYCSYKAVACIMPLLVATVVAMSRYFDNHHHWGDIFTGSMLGLASSYFSYLQYYYPLDCRMSGEPLTTMTESELIESYELECCTRDLNDDISRILRLSKDNSLEDNRKFN